MVCVLPVPVCPYAKMVPLYPSITLSTMGAAASSYRFACTVLQTPLARPSLVKDWQRHTHSKGVPEPPRATSVVWTHTAHTALCGRQARRHI